MSSKKSLNNILDSLIDDDGLKTEVTLTITDETLVKLIIAFVGSGIAVMMLNHVLKNQFPNRQLGHLSKEVSTIKKHLIK